jgi:hypothetical protein
MTNEPTTTNAGGNKPIAYLYYSREAKRRGAKDRLIRIGAVFAHRSGKGRTHLIDALPTDPNWDGRILELEPTETEETAEAEQAE